MLKLKGTATNTSFPLSPAYSLHNIRKMWFYCEAALELERLEKVLRCLSMYSFIVSFLPPSSISPFFQCLSWGIQHPSSSHILAGIVVYFCQVLYPSTAFFLFVCFWHNLWHQPSDWGWWWDDWGFCAVISLNSKSETIPGKFASKQSKTVNTAVLPMGHDLLPCTETLPIPR